MSPKAADFSVSSLGNFVDATTKLAHEWSTQEGSLYPWFRGHAATSWRLVPSLYRQRNVTESDLIFDFVQKAPAFVENMPESNWDRYFLMRQHGLPTRLLDWTESAVIALYFALCRCVARKGAAVWMLDPWWLNRVSTGSELLFDATEKEVRAYAPVIHGTDEEPRLPARPVALVPPYNTDRARAQRLTFTVHGSVRAGLEAQLERWGGTHRHFAKILVPREHMGNMFLEVRRIAGVTESMVFPDLDGLSRDIRMYYELTTE